MVIVESKEQYIIFRNTKLDDAEEVFSMITMRVYVLDEGQNIQSELITLRTSIIICNNNNYYNY